MKKLSKKLLAVVMSIVSIFSIFGMTAVTASAATYTAFNQISSSKVMKTHTITTGNTIPYTNANMTTRGTENRPSKTAYIAGADDLYVYKIGTNSKKVAYAYVSFPVGKTRYKAYIPLSTITSNNGSHAKTIATGKVYTYLRSNGTGGSSSMYISKNDTVYLIATNGNYYQVMYPLGNNKEWRLAWVTKTNYNKYCSGNTHIHSYSTGYEAAHPHRVYKKCKTCGYYYYTGETKKVSGCSTCYPNTSGFQYPVKNYKTAVSFGQKVSYMPSSRNYHLGVDYCATNDSNIYAVSSGTVKKAGWNNANGYYVIIQHTISGKTVYSFYGHLKSYCTSVGKYVSKGKKIGVMGATGSGGNGVNHLHFAFVDSLWSGSYWGYAPSFSGNKTTYQGATYYNPSYVIANGKLPG